MAHRSKQYDTVICDHWEEESYVYVQAHHI